jgi:hypothetical protein
MLFLALAATVAAPQPGELKTFAEWTVGCDNGRACQAVALVPEAEERERYLLLVVRRDGAPRAVPELSFSTDAEPPAGPLTLRVDGKPVARVSGGAALPFNRALASALANGARATLTDGGGRALASASLKGAAAAFLYMDEQQRREGTVGALRRTGPKPDTAVPPPPPLPRIVQAATGSAPPRTLSAATAAKLIGPDSAACDYGAGPVRPLAHRLDASHSLVVVHHPCGNGAYNRWSSFFVLDESGHAKPAAFDAPGGMNPEKIVTNTMVNADWEPAERRLTSYARGRGLGDCGTLQSFAWDGARFRLVDEAVMGECRGSTDYITTWRAETVGG